MHITQTKFSNPYQNSEQFNGQKRKRNKKNPNKIVDLFELSHDYREEIEVLELEFITARIFQLPECRKQKISDVKQRFHNKFYSSQFFLEKLANIILSQNLT